MASRHDQFVADQRKRANQIREQALSGTLRTNGSSNVKTSRSEQFRINANKMAEEEQQKTKKVLEGTLSGVLNPTLPTVQPASKGIDFKAEQAKKKNSSPLKGKLPAADLLTTKIPTTIQSSLKNKVPAEKMLVNTGNGPDNASAIPGVSRYNTTKKEIADSNVPAAVKMYANLMNNVTNNNPIGIALGNAFQGHSGVTHRDSTGNKAVDKVTDIVNDFITPLLTPTGAPVGTGPNVGTYEVAGKALAGKTGQTAVNKIAQGIGKIAPRVNPETAQTIARQGLTETISGPLQGVGIGLTNQQDSNKEIGLNALYGAAGGAAFGFGGATLGASAKSLFSRFLQNKGLTEIEHDIPQAQNVRREQTLALPEGRASNRDIRISEASKRAILDPGEEAIINPTDWRPEPLSLPAADIAPPTRARKGTKPGIGQILEQMQPIVIERMTPPLENPNELAKWIKYHFGGDVSLNEIRALGYEDMRQLGEEIRKRITVEDTARKVAQELGYDYDKLFSTRQVDPNLVKKARKTQDVRDAYGLGNLVKSSEDRYSPFVGEAAVPETIVGFRPGVRNTRVSGDSLNRFQSVPSPTRNEVISAKPFNELTQEDIEYLLKVADERLESNPIQENPVNSRNEQYAETTRKEALQEGRLTTLNISGKKVTELNKEELRGVLQKLVDKKESLRNSGTDPNRNDYRLNMLAIEGDIQTVKDLLKAEPISMPNAEPILRPGQFDEQNGLGIISGSRTKPYDSLSNETRSQLVTRQEKDPISVKGTGDRAYTKLVDDLHPLNLQDKILENLMEEPLKASERVHTLGLSSRGADVISKRIITDGLVDSSGQVVGDSLKSILQPLKVLMKKNKHIYVDFEDYLINKHALTRAERGEKVFRDTLNWTTEYGAQKVMEYEHMFPEFGEAAAKLYEFNRQMVQSWLVDTGIITQDMAQAWIEKNPYYVPNKRQFTKLEKTGKGYGGGKQGFANQSNPVKGYQNGGSQRKIISPIEATIENVDAYVKAAKRNQVMQQYVKNIEVDPDAFRDWAEIVKQPEKPADIQKLILTDDMDADGIDNLLARFSDDFDDAMQRTKLDKDNIVRVMVDGEPVHVLIKDKQLLSALTALGPESAGWMLNLVGKITNNMKLLTTGSNPVFSLTRNLFRDIPQAYVASTTRDNPIGFIVDLVSAAIDIGGRRGAYKQFLNAGGGHASSIAADRNLLNQSKRAVLPGMNAPVRRALGRGKDAYENILNAVEIAPRLAEFKRSYALTSDLQAALAAAQDVTVNFKRRGALSREIDKVFPYFNAAAQGLDKTIRIYKDNPAKAITKSILAITIPTLALYAINHDDPTYKRLSRRQKDAFLMIPKGDGTFFKIAKPQEQGTIFSDIPERLMQLFSEEDPAAFRDFTDRLRTTFTPPGVQGSLKKGGVTSKLLGLAGDTVFGPIADLAANKNFSGSAIVPGYLENLSPELQYDAKTTNVSKKIGELTGTSPKQLDYLARQYTGFIGQFGQPLLSPGGDVGSAFSQQVTADPVFTNDLSTEFYHYKDKLDQANNDSDLRELPEWYNDNLRKQMTKISKQMSGIRAEMRDVQEDKSLSNKVKRDELRKLQQLINDMAERGNELARDVVPY